MKSSRQILSITFLITVVMLSCKKKEQAAETCINNGYFKFLNIGNRWEYLSLYDTTADSTITREIVSKTDNDFFVSSFDGSVNDSSNCFRRECNDWLILGNNTNINEHNTRDVQIPASREIGKKWGGNYFQYVVYEKDITIKTRAGEFVCDKILVRDQFSNIDTYYFSNDIGFIKLSTYSHYNRGYELKSKNF